MSVSVCCEQGIFYGIHSANASWLGAANEQAMMEYRPLHNRSVAHTFLLAAFHSKFTGVQLQSASVPVLEPLSMSL